MNEEPKTVTKRLKYSNDSFPGLDWNNFLKNCNVDFYTSRNDRLWYSLRGKGFIIWISSPYPSKQEGSTVWVIDLEFSRNMPQQGTNALQELIEGAIQVFEKMELDN